jgi:MFS family permease
VNRRGSRLRRSLRASALDGTLAAVMVGFGEMYFAPLALLLGASPFQVGLLATVPMLVGSTFQLLATRLAHRVGDKHWVVGSAVTQAVVCLLVAAVAWTRAAGFVALLGLVCVYWMLNLGINPAWNAWMGRMVPPSLRSRYLSRRTIPVQLFIFLSIVAAGAILQASEHLPWGPALGFAVCFSVAGLARAGSAHFLTRQHDPGKDLKRAEPSLRGAAAGFGRQPYGRLILLIICVIGSVNLSAPYFTPYWLKLLRLNYAQYTVLTAASMIARVVAAPYWGEIARSYGNRRALQVAMVLVMPLSALWVLSDNFAYMLGLQVLAGFAWAGFDLCHILNLFDCTDDRNRAQVLSLFSLMNGTAIVTGSLAGGWLLRWAGDPGYHHLFLLSAAGRAAAILLFAPGVGARRPAERSFANVFVRVITLRPGQGQ